MGKKILNLIGFKNGNLTFVENTGNKNKKGDYIWKVKCECGKLIELPSTRRNSTKSCGCERSKNMSKINNIYRNINKNKISKTRINNPKSNKNKLDNLPKNIYYMKSQNIYYSKINVDGKRIYLGSNKDLKKIIQLKELALNKINI